MCLQLETSSLGWFGNPLKKTNSWDIGAIFGNAWEQQLGYGGFVVLVLLSQLPKPGCLFSISPVARGFQTAKTRTTRFHKNGKNYPNHQSLPILTQGQRATRSHQELASKYDPAVPKILIKLWSHKPHGKQNETVDDSEIRPAPVEVSSEYIPLLTTHFKDFRWLGMGFVKHEQKEIPIWNMSTCSTS